MEDTPTGYKLSLFEDLSRFVGDDSIKHAVNLDLGDGEVIRCSGLVLANTSPHLEDAVKSSDTLKLAGFTKEGVLDCLRLLYGGSITLTLLNFTDILKFGVYFQVPQFPDLCLSWVKVEKNVSSLLTVARVILENEELAEYCGANVWDVKSGQAGMKLLSICWRDKFDHNDLLRECRKTLVQPSNLQETAEQLLAGAATLSDDMILFLFGLDTITSLFSVLQVWINCSKRVNVMLKCLSSTLETQQKEVLIHSEALSNLLDLMDNLTDLPRETTQQIRKLESGIMKRVMNQMIKAVDMNPMSIHEALNNKVWRSFDRKQFKDLKSSLKLPEFLFIEIFLDWTEHAKPSNSDILEIWRDLDMPNVCPLQIEYVRKFIISKYNIPLITPSKKYNFITARYRCNIDLVDQLRDGKYASFTFPLSHNVGLNRTLTLKLRLTVDRDAYTGVSYETDRALGSNLDVSHKVVHWFIIGQEGFSLWQHLLDRLDRGPVFVSLLVNDFETIRSVLNVCSKKLEVFALLEET